MLALVCFSASYYTYPKLVFKFSEMSVWIVLTHFFHFAAEYTGINLSVATCQGLKNSIMDEHKLLLQTPLQWSEYQTLFTMERVSS